MAEEASGEGAGGTDYTGQQGGQGDGHAGGQGDGQSGGDWRTSLPEDLRGAPQLKDVKDVGSLAKQFIDLQRFAGGAIRRPGPDASPQERQEYLQKLMKHDPEVILRPNPQDEKAMAEFWEMAGVPANEDGYDIDQELKIDPEFLKEVKARAKKYGMTKNAFVQMVKDRVEMEQARVQKDAEFLEGEMKTLSNEWGMATEAKINDIKKFAEVMNLPKSFQDALASKKVSADWYQAIDRIIQQFGGMSEGKQVAFQPGGSIPDGPAELRAKINETMRNEAYTNPRHPDHEAMVKKVVKYREQLNAN